MIMGIIGNRYVFSKPMRWFQQIQRASEIFDANSHTFKSSQVRTTHRWLWLREPMFMSTSEPGPSRPCCLATSCVTSGGKGGDQWKSMAFKAVQLDIYKVCFSGSPGGKLLTCASKIFSLVPPTHLRLHYSLAPPNFSLVPPTCSLAPPLPSHLRLTTFPLAPALQSCF